MYYDVYGNAVSTVRGIEPKVVNKVELSNGTVLVDMTDATATSDKILSGYRAYGADGSRLIGFATLGDEIDVTTGNIDCTDDGLGNIVIVNSSSPTPAATLQTKTVSYTSTTTAITDTITADSGYDGLEEVDVTVNAIPSSYIIPSGTINITQNGTVDVTSYASAAVSVAAAKTATGTFTGNGTRQVEISCNFEPDLVYWTSDPGTSASSGTVAGMIARGMMASNRYRNNSTSNSANIQTPITDMNTGGFYNFRATWSNNTVTLYCFSSNTRSLFTNGREYTYTFLKWT